MLVIKNSRKKRKNHENREWSIFGIFFLISFLPALILTIIFWLLGIKTIFYSKHSRHLLSRGYFGVFFFLWILIMGIFTILYVLYFLLKLCRKRTKIRNKAKKYIFLILTDQLLINSFAYLPLKERTKSSAAIILLALFLLNFFNAFFIHYFFTKPAMKFLHKHYPSYFPRYFEEGWLIMKVDNLKFKKKKSSSWPIVLTLIFVDFQIFFLLFMVENYKAT